MNIIKTSFEYRMNRHCECSGAGVTILRGNDFSLSASAFMWDDAEERYIPFDMSGASCVSLGVVGAYGRTNGKDVRFSGNIVTASFGGDLMVGFYGVELTFTDANGGGRMFERNLLRVVESNGDVLAGQSADSAGQASIAVDIRTRTITIGDGTGASDYSRLVNKPSVNGVELVGGLTAAELGLVGSRSVSAVVALTAVEYSSLKEKDPSTLYVITGGSGDED